MTLGVIASALVAGGGCGGGGDLADRLIGGWSIEAGGVERVLLFGDDGSFTAQDGDDEAVTGTFTRSGGQLTIAASNPTGDQLDLTTTFYVSTDVLVIDAALPAADVDGLIGQWRAVFDERTFDAGASVERVFERERTFEFRDEGGVTLSTTTNGATDAVVGLFLDRGSSIRITGEGEDVDFSFTDRRVIGGQIFRRAE